MITGKEKLLETINGSGWQFEESFGDLLLTRREGSRRLCYVAREDDNRGELATMVISFLGQGGGWVDVFSMNHLFTRKGEEKVSFLVMARGDETRDSWLDQEVFYDTHDRWSVGGGPLVVPPFSWQVEEGRRLLYEIGGLPEVLDYEMTANLFVRQMIRGDMTRPSLVPEGYFVPTGPLELAAKDNLKRAGELMISAKSDDEREMAARIYSWTLTS